MVRHAGVPIFDYDFRFGFSTPFCSNQSNRARRICSDSGMPSRALISFSRRACVGSSLSEIMILVGAGTMSVYSYIRERQEICVWRLALLVPGTTTRDRGNSPRDPLGGSDRALQTDRPFIFCVEVRWAGIQRGSRQPKTFSWAADSPVRRNAFRVTPPETGA